MASVVIPTEYEAYHLRQSSLSDFQKNLAFNKACGLLGMFASLHCMDYEWKNCRVAWKGDFGDKEGKKSIIHEAIADEGLHI